LIDQGVYPLYKNSIARKARVTTKELESYLFCGPISRDLELKIEIPLYSVGEQNFINVVRGLYSSLKRTEIPVVPVLLPELKETLPSEIKPRLPVEASSKDSKPTPKKPRSRRMAGALMESDLKLGSALVAHHQYKDGSCTNFTPISCKDLGRQLNLSRNTASLFFIKTFGSYKKYVTICGSSSNLNFYMKSLNGESFSPFMLLGDDVNNILEKPAPESEVDASI
jgi:hypothetical protein